MKELIFEIKANTEVLDQNLRKVLGDNVFMGCNYRSGSSPLLRVHLSDDVSDEDIATIKEIIAHHDPRQLSPNQARIVERKKALIRLLTEFCADLSDRQRQALIITVLEESLLIDLAASDVDYWKTL